MGCNNFSVFNFLCYLKYHLFHSGFADFRGKIEKDAQKLPKLVLLPTKRSMESPMDFNFCLLIRSLLIISNYCQQIARASCSHRNIGFFQYVLICFLIHIFSKCKNPNSNHSFFSMGCSSLVCLSNSHQLFTKSISSGVHCFRLGLSFIFPNLLGYFPFPHLLPNWSIVDICSFVYVWLNIFYC